MVQNYNFSVKNLGICKKNCYFAHSNDNNRTFINKNKEEIMKKIFSVIAAAMLAAPTFAQYSSGGFELDKENVYYGIRIGLTVASLSGESYVGPSTSNHYGMEYNSDLGAKAGMTLAGVIGLRLSHTTPIFLESGLYYTERGGKGNGITVDYNCLEVPLLIKYGIKATDDIAVLPFIGPYFAYAISGKTSQPDYSKNLTTGKFEKTGDKEKVGTFDDDDALTGGLNRFNMGFKIGCGAEYNHLYLEVGYQLGVTNVGKDNRVDLSTHSNAFFANFGVNF